MNTNESPALVLPNGTRYEGRWQYDENGSIKIDAATCGHCGFTWNDALITSVTPTPSGRCPNEYGHVYDDDDDDDDDDDRKSVYSGMIKVAFVVRNVVDEDHLNEIIDAINALAYVEEVEAVAE
jgi:hypothetical protein